MRRTVADLLVVSIPVRLPPTESARPVPWQAGDAPEEVLRVPRSVTGKRDAGRREKLVVRVWLEIGMRTGHPVRKPHAIGKNSN